MNKTNTLLDYCTPYQMRLPLDISILIDINDPVCTFMEVMSHIDLNSYFADKGSKMGRPKYDSAKLLKVILFAFMEHGYSALRNLTKLCKTDIRYMFILDGMPAPCPMTFCNFINNELSGSVEKIFKDINGYIFETEGVDMNHTYIDGTKIEANANKYTWVWKKSCITNRNKIFEKITDLIGRINTEVLFNYGVKMETRDLHLY